MVGGLVSLTGVVSGCVSFSVLPKLVWNVAFPVNILYNHFPEAVKSFSVNPDVLLELLLIIDAVSPLLDKLQAT